MFVGATGVGRVVQRTVDLMKEHDTADVGPFGGIDVATLQRYLNFHYSVSLDLFGAETSTNAANYYAAGLKGRFQEERRDDDHRLQDATRDVPTVADGRITTRTSPALAALNETLRDDYIADCQKGVDRWNRTLADVGLELRLPHVGFNRAVGVFRDHHVSPDGRARRRRDVARARRRLAADRRRPGARRVADARRDRAGEDGRLDRPPATGHPRQAGRLRLRAGLNGDRRGGTDDDVQRGGVAARPPRRRGRRRPDRRSASTARRSTTPTCSARCGGRSGRCARSASAAASGSPWSSTTSRPSRPGSSARSRPASSRCRCRRCSPRASSPRSSADAGAGVAVLSPATPATSTRSPRADAELRHAVVVGEPWRRRADVPVHAWSSFADADEAPVGATGPDSPAFWLYSSGTTGVPKGVMHRHASLQATATTYAARVLGIGPDDRCLSVAKLFFAYGLGNSLTFPFAVGAARDPRPAPADAAGRRRARPRGAADAVLRQPRLRRRPARRRPRPTTVRVGPRDGHCRRGASRRAAAPLHRALRPPGARRHRHHRGTAHLHLQPRRATSGRAPAAQPVPGTRCGCVDEAGGS